MNIDMERIQGLHSRLLDLSRRSTEVIANAQKQRHPFDNLNDAQRLFCGFLAHEAGQLVIAAATKLGLNQSLHADADIHTDADCYEHSHRHTNRNTDSVANTYRYADADPRRVCGQRAVERAHWPRSRLSHHLDGRPRLPIYDSWRQR